MRRLSKLLRLLTLRAALSELEGPRPALRRAPTPSEACELVNRTRRNASLVCPLDRRS
jgi:hypothetical protein